MWAYREETFAAYLITGCGNRRPWPMAMAMAMDSE